jgi:hypothetical protein
MAVRDRGVAALAWRPRVASLAVFVALAMAHTWPLALAPGTLARIDNADTQLNAWILAWVPHQLARDPRHLFDANIFYPEPNTLAFSEHLFVPAMVGAPLTLAGASPLLVHNLVLLAGFALTGWVTCLVLARWTGSWTAGLLAGSVAAFNSFTLTSLPHVQATHAEFLPLALLAFDRLLERPGVRRALALGTWFTLQALCSLYLLVFTTLALVAGALARADEWLPPARLRRVAPAILVAAALAAVLCAPFTLPYARARATQGLIRPIHEVALYSASWSSYVTTGSRLHGALWAGSRPHSPDALFPGVVPAVLTLVALVTGVAWRDRRARMLLAAGAAAFVMSLGPRVPLYAWLYDWVTPLQGIRGAARFGYLGLFCLGGLAGFGLAALRTRFAAASRLAVWIGVSVVALANAEAWRAPLWYAHVEPVPAIYEVLGRIDGAVVAEVPFPPADRTSRNAAYQLASTRHWHPLVNGYSGYVPASYGRHAEVLAGFPDERSLAALREIGVTHVVVHVEHAPELLEDLRAWPALTLVASTATEFLYRLAE